MTRVSPSAGLARGNRERTRSARPSGLFPLGSSAPFCHAGGAQRGTHARAVVGVLAKADLARRLQRVKEVDAKLVLESYEEHALAEMGSKRLLACDPEDESFAARVTACKELIRHHVEEEEEDLFPAVEKALEPEELEALGKRMKARFAQVQAAGFDASVPKGFSKTSADVSKSLKAALRAPRSVQA
jgi:hypothetical protein